MTIKRISFLFLFFYAICFPSKAINRHDLKNDTVKFNGDILLVQKLIQQHKLDAAAIVLLQLKDISRSNKLTLRQQISYFKVDFDILFRTDKYQEALEVAKHLSALADKAKDQKLKAEVYYITALVETNRGAWNIAAQNILKAIAIAEKLNDDYYKVKYYQYLSDIFLELREGERALYYSTKAYGIAKTNNKYDLTKAKMNMILSQVLAGEFDLAKENLNSVDKNIDKKKEPLQLVKVYLFLSHLYSEKKQYELSLEQLNKIPAYYAYLADAPSMRLHTEVAMAECYYELKNYRKANYYFEKNNSAILKEMDLADVSECLALGSKISEQLGDRAKALSYLKAHVKYSDSFNNVSLRKAIHETEIKYQTTLKEKAISEQKLLLVSKDFEIQKKNRYLIVGFSVFCLLVLLASIVYLSYRNRNQSIELSLLKAQIHPHFLFNTLNNLYALSIRKSDEAPGVVMNLASILRYILYECNTLNADLQKEMMIISEYIHLEKIRYAEGLEVNTYFDGDFEDFTIAPLLLLPLVENAYKHGVSKLEHDAWINIEARLKGDQFQFKISNNKPIIKNETQQKTIYGNIGLKNIKKRLNIIYPDRHKFKINQSEDMFVVTLELVAKRKV